MGKVGALILGVLFAFLLAGCYSAAVRVEERLAVKIAAWKEAHPGQEPAKADVDLMMAEAVKEERAARDADLKEAGEKAVSGAGKLATGDYVGGALLLLGAAGIWLGIRKKPIAGSAGDSGASTPGGAA